MTKVCGEIDCTVRCKVERCANGKGMNDCGGSFGVMCDEHFSQLHCSDENAKFAVCKTANKNLMQQPPRIRRHVITRVRQRTLAKILDHCRGVAR